MKRIKKNIDRFFTPPPLIISFKTQVLPPSTRVIWLQLCLYIPLPRRCFHCQLVITICEYCGTTHGLKCTADSSRCVHCPGLHPTSLKSCNNNRYLFEKEVVFLKTLEKLAFAEARERVLSCFIFPGTNFASVLNALLYINLFLTGVY